MKTLKKIYLLALTLLMLSTLSVLASAASLDLNVGTASFQQGTGTESVEIPITVSNNPGIAGLEFIVTYDSALTLEGIDKGTALTTLSPTFPNTFDGNTVRLLWGDAVNDSTNGVIAILKFDVPKETRKDYLIELTIIGASDNVLTDVDVNFTNGKISVTGRPMTGVIANDNTSIYDGQVKNIKLSGVPSGSSVKYTVNGEEFNGSKDVGTYAVTATVTAAGYEDFVVTKTLKINPKTVSVTGYSTANREYDGTTTAVITGGTLNGVVAGDDLKIKSITGEFADKNVGSRKTVTVTVEYEGEQKNYNITKPSNLTASITQKTITVTAKDVGKRVNTADPVFDNTSYTYTPELATGDSFTGALKRAAGENVGTYAILQGTLSLNGNYRIIYNRGIFTIYAKELQTITVADVPAKTYGGEAFDLSVTYGNKVNTEEETIFTSLTENVVTVDTNGKVTIVGAGTAKIKITRLGNNDLADFEKTVIFTVNKLAVKVTAKTAGKTYGDAEPTLEYTYSPELAAGDNFTGALARKSGENAGTYLISLGTLALNSNYAITYESAYFTITPKALTEAMVADVSPQSFTGSAIKLTPALTDGATPVNNTYFTYYYENNTYVGTANVKVTGKGNYTGTITREFAITAVDQTPAITATASVRRDGNTLDLKRLVANAKGDVSFAISGESNGCTLENGVLTSGENVATVKINVSITAKDINGDTVNEYNAVSLVDAITVTITDKEPQAALNITSASTVTYGRTLTLATRGGTGSGAVTYAVTAGTGDAAIEGNVLTPTKAGTVTVVATKAEDAVYNSISSAPFVITIEKVKVAVPNADTRVYTYNGTEQTYRIAENAAYTIDGNKNTLANETGYTVTVALKNTDTHAWSDGTTEAKTYNFIINKATIKVTAKNQTIYVNGTVPTLNETFYTVTGLANGETLKTLPTIEYETTPDATQTGTTVIKVYGAEAPDEINYNGVVHTNGTLTVRTMPSTSSIVTTPTTYTVKFEANGGTTVSKQTIEKDKTVNIPEAPTKEGYTFDGWYTDKELTNAYNFATKVTRSITLYAKWTEVEKEPEWVNPYFDVNKDDWFYISVETATKNGLINGIGANKFGANETLSRAMLITMLYRLAGTPEVTANADFADISADSWYSKAVAWGAENGIVNGVEGGKFAPDTEITREQMAVMLYRYAGFVKADVTVSSNKAESYADFDSVSSYATDGIKWAVDNGIINGDTNTTLSPADNATRAQAATIIVRFMELVK